METNNHLLELFKGLDKDEAQRPQSKRDPKMAVIYTRVSDRKQVEGASLEAQHRICTEYAIRNDYTVMEYFGGTYESAQEDDRKEFNRLMKFLNTNKVVSKVLVFSIDRFSRTGGHAISLDEELAAKGIYVIGVTQPFDSSSPVGKLFKDMMYIHSRADNDMRREKTVTGMRERLRQGYWVSSLPIGYTNLNLKDRCDKHKIVVNEKGELLRQAFQWKLLKLYSDVEIAQRLTDAGLKITAKRLYWLFRNPFYCGIIKNSIIPGEVIVGKHPAIVSIEDFLRINNLLAENSGKRSAYGREDDMLPLKVFMKCETTGAVYTGYLNQKKNIYYYKTRGKGTKQSRNAKVVNSLFEEHLKNYELVPALRPLLEQAVRNAYAEATKDMMAEQQTLKHELADNRKKLETLERKLLFEGLEREFYDKYAPELKTNITRLEIESGRMEQVHSSNLENVIEKAILLSQNLSKTWASSDIKNKQKLQALVFPDGIWYNRKNDAVLTTRVNSIFQIIAGLKRDMEGQKKGKPPGEGGLSHLVTPKRFELLTF